MNRVYNRKVVRLFLLASVIFLVFIIKFDTISYLVDRYSESGNISAASFEDFLQRVSFETTEGRLDNPNKAVINPQKIIVEKSSTLNNNTMIYFEFEGEILSYIQHMNPLKLESSISEREIVINVDLEKFLNNLSEDSNDISGKLYIKYLNEYLIKSYDIILTRSYIANSFLSSMDFEQITYLDIISKNNTLMQIINRLNEYVLSSPLRQDIIYLDNNKFQIEPVQYQLSPHIANENKTDYYQIESLIETYEVYPTDIIPEDQIQHHQLNEPAETEEVTINEI